MTIYILASAVGGCLAGAFIRWAFPEAGFWLYMLYCLPFNFLVALALFWLRAA